MTVAAVIWISLIVMIGIMLRVGPGKPPDPERTGTIRGCAEPVAHGGVRRVADGRGVASCSLVTLCV
jgi:hypothetical protein